MKPRLLVLGLILMSSYLVGLNCSGATNGTSGTPGVADPSTYAVKTFPPAPDLEDRLRLAAQFAEPGTIFELPAGTYAFNADITFDVSHLIIRGQGMDQTILDFSGQTNGSQGILARGDHFTVQDFTVLNPEGNGIKTEFIDGATYHGSRSSGRAAPRSRTAPTVSIRINRATSWLKTVS